MAKKIIGINQTKKENTINIDGYVVSDEYYIKEFKKDDVTEGKLLKFKLHNIQDKKHNYFDISGWNETADYIREKINKEDYIRIEGHLESNTYLKNNEKVYTINIIADHVELVQSLEEQHELKNFNITTKDNTYLNEFEKTMKMLGFTAEQIRIALDNIVVTSNIEESVENAIKAIAKKQNEARTQDLFWDL